MRRGGILIMTAGLLLVILGSYAVAQHSVGDCAAPHEKWSEALAGLRDRLEVYSRVKGESLEPQILELMKSSSGTRTTVARIVRTAIKEHKRKLDEAEQEVRGAEAQERTALSNWQACIESNRGRSNRQDRAFFQDAQKARRELLKDWDRLLLNPAYVKNRQSGH